LILLDDAYHSYYFALLLFLVLDSINFVKLFNNFCTAVSFIYLFFRNLVSIESPSREEYSVSDPDPVPVSFPDAADVEGGAVAVDGLVATGAGAGVGAIGAGAGAGGLIAGATGAGAGVGATGTDGLIAGATGAGTTGVGAGAGAGAAGEATGAGGLFLSLSGGST
jgi:hypothetical protein